MLVPQDPSKNRIKILERAGRSRKIKLKEKKAERSDKTGREDHPLQESLNTLDLSGWSGV